MPPVGWVSERGRRGVGEEEENVGAAEERCWGGGNKLCAFALRIEMKAMKCILGLLLAGAQLQAVAQGSLLVSEVLFQPRSGEAEYVELYNGSSNMVELSDFMMVRWVGDSLGTRYALPQHVVAPHDYVVLTKDAASVATR